jgi:hypothetical protein
MLLSSVVRSDSEPRVPTFMVTASSRTPRFRTLWKSFRNHPGQGSDKRRKLAGLKSESLPGFIPESCPD